MNTKCKADNAMIHKFSKHKFLYNLQTLPNPMLSWVTSTTYTTADLELEHSLAEYATQCIGIPTPALS